MGVSIAAQNKQPVAMAISHSSGNQLAGISTSITTHQRIDVPFARPHFWPYILEAIELASALHPF